jgi:hypothetical protein
MALIELITGSPWDIQHSSGKTALAVAAPSGMRLLTTGAIVN